MANLNGSINVESTIAQAFKSKVTNDIIGAIQAAQASVGPNFFVKEAELDEAYQFLVYQIKVVDENMKKYKIIVDPGNGQVLLKKLHGMMNMIKQDMTMKKNMTNTVEITNMVAMMIKIKRRKIENIRQWQIVLE